MNLANGKQAQVDESVRKVAFIQPQSQPAAAKQATPSGAEKPRSTKSPIFLGINIESDPDYARKLATVFSQAYRQAGKPKHEIEEFKSMVNNMKAADPWKFPNSHHVTTLFIGGNKKKMQSPIFEFHQEGKEVTVEVRAVIIIDKKIIVGICFPETEIENEFPHLTLMVSQGWAPVLSNQIIQATCAKGKAFEKAYQ